MLAVDRRSFVAGSAAGAAYETSGSSADGYSSARAISRLISKHFGLSAPLGTLVADRLGWSGRWPGLTLRCGTDGEMRPVLSSFPSQASITQVGLPAGVLLAIYGRPGPATHLWRAFEGADHTICGLRLTAVQSAALTGCVIRVTDRRAIHKFQLTIS